MKKLSIIALCLFSAACSKASEAPVADCCSSEAPEATTPTTLPDTSVYLLGTKWLDQDGSERELHQFQDEIVIAAMIFTNCEYACPRIIIDLKEIESKIPVEQLAKVRWLLVSMDSARDTPEVLAAYAKDNELDTERWTLLHGDDFAVRGFAAALGMRYKKNEKGNFAHSNIITVLDQEGRIAHQLKGLGADGAATVAAVAELIL